MSYCNSVFSSFLPNQSCHDLHQAAQRWSHNQWGPAFYQTENLLQSLFVVFIFDQHTLCVISSAEVWPPSLCSVSRIALWTRRRTSWSAWRPSERRSAWGLARRWALTLSNLEDRYSLLLFEWRTAVIQCHIIIHVNDSCDSYVCNVSFRGSVLPSSFITRSWRQCWKWYVRCVTQAFTNIEIKCQVVYLLIVINPLLLLLKLPIFHLVGREASVCPEFQVCYFSVYVIISLCNID